jgi:putative ABC transport system substrate-binding protein
MVGSKLKLWLAVLALVSAQTVAEKPESGRRIGVLMPPIPSVFEIPLLDSLRELGYVDGKTASVDVRRSEGPQDHWRALAHELVRSKPDIIVAIGTPAARAALDATTTIPVVFGVGDALETGLAATLAKPDRNGTGVTAMSTELSAKRLELLLEIVPKARRIGYLFNPATPLGPRMHQEVGKAASVLHVQIEPFEAKNAREIEAALDGIKRSPPDAFLVSSEILFMANRHRIVETIAKLRLPAVFPWRMYVTDGAPLSYGTSNEDAVRRMALYVDRILKGAKPSTLPIEQISEFKLVVNVKAAKAQGMKLPDSVLLRASEVIH